MDRYEAQPCHCGEPNCVGAIGGKTQTDIGGMNDLFLEGHFFCFHREQRKLLIALVALGITDEVELMEMRGNKKKKSRQLDEDFVVRKFVFNTCSKSLSSPLQPILRPINEHETQKVAAAMRQSMENTKMMSRLLERISVNSYIPPAEKRLTNG